MQISGWFTGTFWNIERCKIRKRQKRNDKLLLMIVCGVLREILVGVALVAGDVAASEMPHRNSDSYWVSIPVILLSMSPFSVRNSQKEGTSQINEPLFKNS